MFTKIKEATALTAIGGVWTPREVHKFNDRLFVKIGTGFVPMIKEDGCLKAKVGNKTHFIKQVVGIDDLAVRFDGSEVRVANVSEELVFMSDKTYKNLRSRANELETRMRAERKARDSAVGAAHNVYLQGLDHLGARIARIHGHDSELYSIVKQLKSDGREVRDDEN